MRANPYTAEQYLREYLLFHYGQRRDLCPFRFVPTPVLRFHTRLREECLRPVDSAGATRGLDIGCGVGRFTFELGCVVDQVLGIDSSAPFIAAARQMARRQSLTIPVKQTGREAVVRRLMLPRALRQSRVQFQVGDALNLRALDEKPFHVVAAINLLCRLPRPRQFLAQLGKWVLPGGQLLIASPYTWMEEWTAPNQWVTAKDMQALLCPQFRLVRRCDLPFLIREHRRKYQLGVSEVMVWERKKVR
ncbi:MAG TPA: methyltransferase domain-containing protein [Bacillota bacterium]|nr:methyltransferase domain-containing protein [Bacillota bacterium]